MATVRVRGMLAGAVCAAALLTLGACATMDGMDKIGGLSLANLPQDVLGEWKAESLAGFDLTRAQREGLRLPTMAFASDGSVSGFAGVNRFRGSTDPASLAQGKFSLPQAVSTKMAGPPVANEMENAFLSAISSADGATMKDGKLLLTSGGEALLTLVR